MDHEPEHIAFYMRKHKRENPSVSFYFFLSGVIILGFSGTVLEFAYDLVEFSRSGEGVSVAGFNNS
jgi:hypothetical protein